MTKVKSKNTRDNVKLLMWLQGFNGVTAVAGGLSLILELGNPPLNMLENTVFDSYFLPGVVLLSIVGGSALYALIILYKNLPGAYSVSALAGLIMLFWIIGEVASLREINPLQLIYLFTSLTIIAKTPNQN